MNGEDSQLATPSAIDHRDARRTKAFDGLRGAACLLLVGGGLRVIVPSKPLDRSGPLRGLFYSSEFAVIVLLVVGAFLATSRLLDQRTNSGTVCVSRFWLRRLARVGPHLAVFVVAIATVSALDRWDEYSAKMTARSLLAVSTFTFNWTMTDHLDLARPDLGHLWWLSVEQQVCVVAVGVLIWLDRFAWLIGVLLVASTIAVVGWRFHVYDTDGWWPAHFDTSTRADAVLVGALCGLVVHAQPPVCSWVRGRASLASLGLVALAFVILRSPELSEHAYLQVPGVVFTVASAATVLAIAGTDHQVGFGERLIGVRPLRAVGRVWFPLFLWHLPAFFAAERWARDVDWLIRSVLTLGVVGAVGLAADRLITQPINRRLDRPPTRRRP